MVYCIPYLRELQGALGSLGRRVSRTDVLHALEPYVRYLQRDTAGPTRHVDRGVPRVITLWQVWVGAIPNLVPGLDVRWIDKTGGRPIVTKRLANPKS